PEGKPTQENRMRTGILLSFLTGALLALVVVSTPHTGRKTAVVMKPSHPVVKPATLEAANLAPAAPTFVAPVTVLSHSVARTSRDPVQKASGAPARSFDPPRVRMERDPNTGELRPCVEAATKTAAVPTAL